MSLLARIIGKMLATHAGEGCGKGGGVLKTETVEYSSGKCLGKLRGVVFSIKARTLLTKGGMQALAKEPRDCCILQL